MPIDIKNIAKPTKFYWPGDDSGQEWVLISQPNRKELLEIIKKSNIKQTAEFKLDPKTKVYQRVQYIDSDLDRDLVFSELMLDLIIVDWNFVDLEGEPIPCTKENKILMASNIPFRTWIDECIEVIKTGKKQAFEEEIKNS
jgi:hypothetical protein